MKTPEEMAEEYCEDHDECEFARDAFLAGYDAAQTNLPTPAKWISVFAKTPPIENDGDESIKFLTIDKWGQVDVLFWDWMDWQNMDVSFWMPLPEPPKENE